MALHISEIRKLDRKFSFTVRLDDRAKPLEVVCETKAVAHRRVEALQAAASAWAETVHGAQLH